MPGEGIVSDHGAVFRAHDYTAILRALEIEPTYIELRKPWQNLIEAQFKVQLRLADFKFEQAQTFEEIQALHAAFIETFNTTRHWAHQEREDGRRTPVDVLGWVRGRSVERARLRQLFGRSAVPADRQSLWLYQRATLLHLRGTGTVPAAGRHLDL